MVGVDVMSLHHPHKMHRIGAAISVVESLAALVPRVDIDGPIGVAVDLMTERVVTMFMLGTPFQASYSMPTEIAHTLSRYLLNARDNVRQQTPAMGRLAN